MASSRVLGVRLDPVLQHARVAVFGLSPDRKLVWVNRAWEDLTGHDAASVVGLPCQAHGPTEPGDLTSLGASFAPPGEALEGRPAASKTLLLRADGARLWKRLEFWPLTDRKGELALLLGFVGDAADPALAPESESARLRVELLELRERVVGRTGIDNLVGSGPAHRRLLDQIDAASGSGVPALIVGEPGTGKRLVGRTIHQLGPRPRSPLVPIDAAALPGDVLDRTLFGPPGEGRHEPPRLAFPEGTTLLISDALALPRDLQALLAPAARPPYRLIATTADDPDEALRSERLRPDLYYLLTALVIRLSPLRERLGELPLLAQHFLERSNRRGGRQRGGFRAAAVEALLTYDWPGNLRELARVVEYAAQRGAHDTIDVDDLPTTIRGALGSAYTSPAPPPPPADATLDQLLTQVERRLIEAALTRARHNKSRAAEALGISRPRLYRRIKELDIPEEPDPGEEGAGAP